MARSTFLAHPVRLTLVPALAVAAAGAWFAADRWETRAWPLGWFLGISVATYAIWWIDKRQSKRGGYRVPEWTLHGLAALGGGIAGVLAMQKLRHKTRKRAFKVGQPLLAALSAAALGWFGLGMPGLQ